MSDQEEDKTEDEEDKEIVLPKLPRRYNRRLGDQHGNSTSIWLISFTDVMALMLTFFVLLFAMSNPEQEKFDQFRENISKNFNKNQGQQLERGAEDAINIAKVDFNKALDLRYLRVLVQNLIEENPELGSIVLLENAGQLIVSLPQEILFASGQASIKPEATRTLFSLIQTLKRIKNSIEIIGHTDPRPTSSEQFASNWELSLSRAASVAGLIENAGYTRPVKIKGYAAARYYDLSDDFSEEDRMALSRRVDIIIREDDGRRFKLFEIGGI
ncbi:MAG: flagellar motor protein MotB [Pseudomonadota bacterium]